MASIVVNQGLQRIGVQSSQATGSPVTYNVARQIQVMSLDDQSSAFLATDLDLDRSGGLTVSNAFDQALSPAPTRTGQVITHVTTYATGVGNFTTRRLALHDDTAGNVTTSSDTLVSGVDGQSLTKTNDFTMTPTLKLTYTNV